VTRWVGLGWVQCARPDDDDDAAVCRSLCTCGAAHVRTSSDCCSFVGQLECAAVIARASPSSSLALLTSLVRDATQRLTAAASSASAIADFETAVACLNEVRGVNRICHGWCRWPVPIVSCRVDTNALTAMQKRPFSWRCVWLLLLTAPVLACVDDGLRPSGCT